MGLAGGTGNDNGSVVARSASPAGASAPAFSRSPNVAQAILLASAAAQLALSLLITIYLARELSPAAFGFFSLVSTVFILARKFLDLGLGNVAARDIARDPERERPILEGMMAYRRVTGVLLALAMLGFAMTQRAGPERWVLFGVATVLLFTEPAALDPVFQVRQAQGGPALLNVFGGLVVLGGSLLYKRLDVAGALFGSLLVAREAISLLGTKFLAERLLGYHPKPGFRGRNLRAFVGPALIFGLASLVYTIYFHCDVFLVLIFRGREELGAYAAAFRPINPLLVLPWLLMVPLIPVLSATASRDMELFVRQVRSAAALAAGIGACTLVAGVMLAPDLVQLLYKGRYLDGSLSSVNAFSWLAVALGQVCVTTVLTASLLAAGREKLLLAIGTAALVANLALNAILLQHYDFTAAGFATATTELLFLLCSVIAFLIATRRSAVPLNAIIYLLPAVVMGLVLHFVHSSPAARVMCGILLGGISVAGMLFAPPARQLRRELRDASDVIPR